MTHGRAALICLLSAAFGAVVARRDLLDDRAALAVATGATLAVVLVVFAEALRGGHGPIIRTEMVRLVGEIAALRGQITELEIVIVTLKAAVNATLRRGPDAAPSSTAGTTGRFPAQG